MQYSKVGILLVGLARDDFWLKFVVLVKLWIIRLVGRRAIFALKKDVIFFEKYLQDWRKRLNFALAKATMLMPLPPG